ncbi:MAG TPA: hypothetical protein VK906_12425 [Egicoccus sp.]|nr:hypothetical protein [Egicoccus sp.]HSK23980.1 hypothetical protein [Egicoccus sp.]
MTGPGPLFAYHAVPLPLDPAETLARLLADPAMLTTATADAIGRCGPRFADWGLPMHLLPTVETVAAGDQEPGQLRLRWSGPEDVTGWPSLTAWLVVSPRAAGSRITFVSTRSPATGLGATSVHRGHAQRLLAVAVQAFLQALAGHLVTAADSPATAIRELSGATR